MNNETPTFEPIRNIGIIAHIDAGKTTVSERILYYTHKIYHMGEVHNGNTTMDFMPEEQERGITIAAACTSCSWNDYHINLIDTPGHVDFSIEVERSLRVLDGAVGIFCAVGGVEPQSETVWRQSQKFSIPKIAFINKMDKIGADFSAALESMKTRLQAYPIAIQVPLGAGEDFYALADLIYEQKLTFDPDKQGAVIKYEEFNEEEQEIAQEWREKMLEAIAEVDDDFLQIYLEENYDSDDIQNALRRITLNNRAIPVLAGAALKNIGIQPLLDAVIDYLPSVIDVAPLNQEENRQSEHLQALTFKVFMEDGEKVALLRLYQGILRDTMQVYNVTQKQSESISEMFRLHADRREELSQAFAGDIVAVTGFESVKTGDTIGLSGDTKLFENLDAYPPVMVLAFEARNAEELEILDKALEHYSLEDPTISVQIDAGSEHRLVSGMGELHLDVLYKRLCREYAISPRVGNPHVVYCETIENENAIPVDMSIDKDFGDEHHHASISLSLQKNQRHQGNTILFSDDINLTKSTKSTLNTIINDCLQSGSPQGYALQDVQVYISKVGQEYSQTGLEIATTMALREAFSRANYSTLEPIMHVEMTAPEEHLGASLNLLNMCRGQVEQLTEQNGLKHIEASAPMRELFGFSTRLRSVSQGRVGLVMRFKAYDRV